MLSAIAPQSREGISSGEEAGFGSSDESEVIMNYKVNLFWVDLVDNLIRAIVEIGHNYLHLFTVPPP